MPLCFIDARDAIRVIADSVGRVARRAILVEVVDAWVDDIPDQELGVHYEKAVAGLAEEELHMLAVWHAELEVAQPIANPDFLLAVFPTLGDSRREALKLAAGFRGEDAFDAGVTEERTLAAVLPHLSRERARRLAERCLAIYVEDRLGSPN